MHKESLIITKCLDLLNLHAQLQLGSIHKIIGWTVFCFFLLLYVQIIEGFCLVSELATVTISSFEEVPHVTFIIFIIISFRFYNYCGVKIKCFKEII